MRSPQTRNYARSRTAARRQSGRAKRVWTWEKLVLLVIIAVSTVSVVIAMVVLCSVNPERAANVSLEELASEYYREKLYPSLIGNQASPEAALAEYREGGAPTVYLRQILLYDNGKNRDRRADFMNANYNCDTNHTGVRFFPEPPYGETDFRAEYYWSCEKVPILE